jgi:predicted metal-dependent peptidase
MKNAKDFKLEMHTVRLLDSEPFFTVISRNITKVSTPAVETAALRLDLNSGYFKMLYNPNYLDSLGKTNERGEDLVLDTDISRRRDTEIVGVLKHEFYHFIFGHLTSRLPFDIKDNSERTRFLAHLWNIACDLAINSHIFNELPWHVCVPGRIYIDKETGIRNSTFANYPLGLSSEAYFEMLKLDINLNVGSNFGQFDAHYFLGDSDTPEGNAQREIAKELWRDSIQEAVDESVKSGWGSVSSEIQKSIFSSIRGAVDWKQVLRSFVFSSVRAERKRSIRKINKRYAYVQSGTTSSHIANIALSIDQSGSVSDSMLAMFFAELRSLSQIASFTVIPFDCFVSEDKIYKWKKGGSHVCERVLTGGTDFNAPTNYVNAHNFDGHIVLTDLCAPFPEKSTCKRMWMTVEGCDTSAFQFKEKVIVVPNRDISNFEKK